MHKMKMLQSRAQAGAYIFFQVNADVVGFSGTGLRNFCHKKVFLRSEFILPATN
jgi:hypothetical protein